MRKKCASPFLFSVPFGRNVYISWANSWRYSTLLLFYFISQSFRRDRMAPQHLLRYAFFVCPLNLIWLIYEYITTIYITNYIYTTIYITTLYFLRIYYHLIYEFDTKISLLQELRFAIGRILGEPLEGKVGWTKKKKMWNMY